MLGAVEPSIPLSTRERVVECSLLVQASPERVWKEIHNADAIRPEEVDTAWLFRISVPLPEAGVSRETLAVQLVCRPLGLGLARQPGRRGPSLLPAPQRSIWPLMVRPFRERRARRAAAS